MGFYLPKKIAVFHCLWWRWRDKWYEELLLWGFFSWWHWIESWPARKTHQTVLYCFSSWRQTPHQDLSAVKTGVSVLTENFIVRNIEVVIFFPFMKFKWSLKTIFLPLYFSELIMLYLGSFSPRLTFPLATAWTSIYRHYPAMQHTLQSAHSGGEKNTHILLSQIIMCLGYSWLQKARWQAHSGAWHYM